MTQVPSWVELCMVVDELSKTQNECYSRVHQLLDSEIPELDRKLEILKSKPGNAPLTTIPISVPILKPTVHPTYVRSKAPSTNMVLDEEEETLPKAARAVVATTSDPVMETNSTDPTEVTLAQRIPQTRTATPPDGRYAIKATAIHETERTNRVATNTMTNRNKTSLKDLEHLQAPSRPLCDYLKRNRPDILKNVEARSSYIRKISEERRSLRTYKILSSLERIRLTGRSKYQSCQNKQVDIKNQRRGDLSAPNYYVRHKQSEREMKRLTLKNYRRLPEVRKQKQEEINKHLKDQYYKNRQLYGKMLLINFKNGIIDYPLRASYDNRSITSSQSEYSMSQSADTACSLDPYY